MGRSEAPPATTADLDGPTVTTADDTGPPDTHREPMPGLPADGEIVAGKYRVERAIGSGGMGHVLAVRHVALDRLFAMKLLDPRLVDDADARARFAREARAMSALTSRHTVRVHDVAELPTGLPFLVMDHLEGEDFSRVLARRGPLPIDEAIEWIDQACEAVEEAHAAGLVHRDLKPKNLFLARDPIGESVRVLDFGIARALGGRVGKAATITRHGDFVGTLSYMAPEQIRSARSVDHRTDIWALGACLYRFLTNARPFVAENEGALVEAILAEEPRAIRELRPEIPPALALVVGRCMRKAPAERFATVAALREGLRLARSTHELPLDDRTVPMRNAPMRLDPRAVPSATAKMPPVQLAPPVVLPLPPPVVVQPPPARARPLDPIVVLIVAIGGVVLAAGVVAALLLAGRS